MERGSDPLSAPPIAPLGADVCRRRWDAIADAVLITDGSARYLDANRAALGLLGYSLRELCALTIHDVVAHDAGWTAFEYQQLLDTGYWEGRCVVRPKNQTLVIVEARASVVRLSGGDEYVSVLRERWIPSVRPAVSATADLLTTPGIAKLTPREREVIALIADGATSAQIAAHLGISARTADSHRHQIMRKLEVYSIAALTRLAVRHGLTRDE